MVLTVQKTIVIPLTQYIDMVVDVPVGQVQQIPRVLSVTPQLHASYSFLDNVVDMPVVFNDRCPYLSVHKNCEGPAVALLLSVADVPVVQVQVPQVPLRL